MADNAFNQLKYINEFDEEKPVLQARGSTPRQVIITVTKQAGTLSRVDLFKRFDVLTVNGPDPIRLNITGKRGWRLRYQLREKEDNDE